MNIMTLIVEQQNKVLAEHNGGFKYGKDYNILKAIIEHLNNETLIKNLVKTIKDRVLAGKVKTWMEAAV